MLQTLSLCFRLHKTAFIRVTTGIIMARHLLLTSISLALLFGLNHQADAQDQTPEPTRQERALAAGYKAMFSCSAIFNGDKSSEQISGDELSNYYGDYICLLYTSPSPRDRQKSRMPSSA